MLTGLGAYVPPRVVSNRELCARLDTSDEWIRSRIGVSSRRIAEGEATVGLAVRAGQRALAAADRSAVGAVIMATTSADRLCPAGAPEVASQLGLGSVPAFDIAAACSGFVYGLAVASSLVTSGAFDSVLLIASEAITALVDPSDRLTSVIFADGAGAVVLTAGHAGQPGALGPFDLGSDGTNADLVHISGGGTRAKKHAQGPDSALFLRMDGPRVFELAVTNMCRSVRRVLAQAGCSVGDLDAVIAHQANQRILDAVAVGLGLDTHLMLSNLAHVGNTAAASVPLLMAEAAASGALCTGQRVVLASFGAGLTWGSTVLIWPEVRSVVE